MTQTEWLCNNRNLFSHGSGGWKSKIKVPAQSGSGESPFPGCRQLSSHCVLTRWGEGRSSLILFQWEHQSYHEGPPSQPHLCLFVLKWHIILNLNCFLLLILYKISFPEPLKGLVLNSFDNHILLELPVCHSCQASVQGCGGFYSELDSLSHLLSELFSFVSLIYDLC